MHRLPSSERVGVTFYSRLRLLRALLVGPTLYQRCPKGMNNQGSLTTSMQLSACQGQQTLWNCTPGCFRYFRFAPRSF